MKKVNEAGDFKLQCQKGTSRAWGAGCKVGIIGGLGEMGSLFARFFRNRGYHVDISDQSTERDSREVIRSSDMVIFAVPLHRTVDIIRDLVPHVRPDQLIMDLTSLKVAPVQEMLRSSASVVGLHPMFGGRISTFEGQTLVACPVRIDPSAWSPLHRLFTEAGIRVKETTPEEHDRMMSIIQVLFHMNTMLKGRVLRELGVDITETMEYTSPSYRLEIGLLGRMFAQSGTLYSAITQMNPYTRELIVLLREGLDHYKEWYEKEDLEAFVRDFERSSKSLGDFTRHAYQESSSILDFTVKQAGNRKHPLKSDEDER